MLAKNLIKSAVVTFLALVLVGCENLPGGRKEQGAVIGGATGAATGAVLGGERHRGIGAVIGGVLGAAGGYVIGSKTGGNNDDAEAAARRAQENPATPQDALSAITADLNSDGFVTLDEVAAMERANLKDNEMIERLRATNQVFDLTPEQKRYLLDRGVSQNVVDQMTRMNRDSSGRSLSPQIQN
jgi:hypothetical protein